MWALALELAQFGVDPSIIKRIVSVVASRLIWETIRQTRQYYFFHPNMIGKEVPEMTDLKTAQYYNSYGVGQFIGTSIDDIARGVVRMELAAPWIERFRARYGSVDLTRLLLHVEQVIES